MVIIIITAWSRLMSNVCNEIFWIELYNKYINLLIVLCDSRYLGQSEIVIFLSFVYKHLTSILSKVCIGFMIDIKEA